MRIAILYSSYEDSADELRDLDPVRDPSVYLDGHACHLFPIVKARAVRQVLAIAREGFDVAINLCDGAWHGDTAGVEVVQVLERVNLAFTGASAALYDPSREAMKMACHAVGVNFPAYVMLRSEADVELVLTRLRFPLIVKPPQGYSSVGLSRESRVEDEAALRRQAAQTMAAYGTVLVEEFIDGPEYTVLVAEGRTAGEDAWALDPVEFRFPSTESFKHFDLKWKHFEQMTTHPVDDPVLRERLKDAAARAFAGLGCEGYARCDFRADEAGELYLLELNPNCAVFYPEGQFGSADFILAADAAGHRGFLAHLLACAARRQARLARAWEVAYTRDRGFGLVAPRALRAGEVVQRYEEQAATLVTRAHAMRHWTGPRRRWFDQYAWPLTYDTHVMWSANPDDWRPINHACDPNTWLDGLDVVAMRDVAAGDELTLDYATFCGPEMEQFECRCGSPRCRHVITGHDYLLPAVREAYGAHVSDYIRARLDASEPLDAPAVLARRDQHGLGVVASRALQCGEVLARFTWSEMLREPTVHTIQTGAGQHAEPRPFWLRYLSHSCAPNVVFDTEAMAVRVIRDVAVGETLGFFYPSTEWDMRQPFECGCQAPECLGWIAGASRLAPEVLARYEVFGMVKQQLAR